MSHIASSGSPTLDALSEYTYVAKQLTRICIESAINIVFSLVRSVAIGITHLFRGGRGTSSSREKSKTHAHECNSEVCEECMKGFTSSGSPFIDALREYAHTGHEILLIFAKFVLFVCMGLGMLVAAVFPAMVGGKSAYDEELDNKYREKRKREWSELQRDKNNQQSFDDERDAHFKAHHEKLRALKAGRAELGASQSARAEQLAAQYQREVNELDEYEKNRSSINGPELSAPKLFSGTELAEDDHLVSSINNAIKGVENGTEEAEKVRKLSEELMKQRRETSAKDEKRRDLLNQSRAKDWEGHRLLTDGDRAAKEGDWKKADDLYRRGDAALGDANGLYNQYLSV